MFKEFRVTNFKAFRDKQTIPVKPITLVFGANGAGKSSVLQSLLWTMGAAGSGTLEYGSRGQSSDSVDFGSFADIPFKKSGDRMMRIAMDVPLFDGVECTLSYEVGLPCKKYKEEKIPPPEPPPEVMPYKDARDKWDAVNEEKDKEYSANLRDEDGHLLTDENDDWIPNPDWDEDEWNKKWHPVLQSAWEKLCESVKVYGEEHAQWWNECMWPWHNWEKIVKEPLIYGFEFLVNGAVLFRCEKRSFSGLLDIVRVNSQMMDWDVNGPGNALRSSAENDPALNDPDEKGGGDGFWEEEELKGILNLEFTGLNPLTVNRNEASKGPKKIANKIKHRMDGIIRYVRDNLSGLGRNIVHLGPLRILPPRHLMSYDVPVEKNSGGEAWERLRDDNEIMEKVNSWLSLSRLGSGYEFKSKSLYESGKFIETLVETMGWAQLTSYDFREKSYKNGVKIEHRTGETWAELRDEHEDSEDPEHPGVLSKFKEVMGEGLLDLQLMDSVTDTPVTHRDVGVGLSQLIPVVVNAVSSSDKLIAVEQPEIHLHPAMQAKMGDLFIESAMKENGNRFLLETHSEHLILRILRRIRETSAGELPEGVSGITPDEVCVLFVERTGEGSTVKEIPVTSDGDFAKPWPGGFFPERSEELF